MDLRDFYHNSDISWDKFHENFILKLFHISNFSILAWPVEENTNASPSNVVKVEAVVVYW